MSQQFEGAGAAFTELLKTISKLRDPVKGCPWDLEQTSKSLLPYLLEEAQEFISTIENNDEQHIQEELGDVLFQVVLHSQISTEKNLFTAKQLCLDLTQKLIERHPHVFSNQSSTLNAQEVKIQWNKNKVAKAGLQKLHDAMKLPPMIAADKIGSFSHTVGFDWENAIQVLTKVAEEFAEVSEAMEKHKNSQNIEHLAEEIGDLLFSVTQLARHNNLSADYCLNLANRKFYNRFLALDEMIKGQNKDLLTMSLDEKEVAWQRVKNMQKSQDHDD